MLTMAIPDNGPQLYRTSYAVRSAITATPELLVYLAPFAVTSQFLWSDTMQCNLRGP